jgi:hypothetical protein
MAVFSRREEVSRKVIFFVLSPTNFAEFDKAMTAATRELSEKRKSLFDDSLAVEAHDDEIHISYTEKVDLPAPKSQGQIMKEAEEAAQLDSVIFHIYFASGKWKKRTESLSDRDKEAAAQAVERHIDTMRNHLYDNAGRIHQDTVLDNPDVMEQNLRWWEPEV